MFEFIHRLWGLTRPYRGRLLLGIGFGLAAGVMEAAVPAAISLVFALIFPDSGRAELARRLEALKPHFPRVVEAFESASVPGVASGQEGPSFGWVVLVVSLIPLVMLVRGAVGYLNAYLLNWVAVHTLADFRSRLLDHLLRLPLRVVQRFGTGELMSRLNNDVAALHNALANSFVSLIKDPVALVAFVAYLIFEFRGLTLTALVVFPVCVVPVVIFARKLRKAMERLQNDAAEVSQVTHDTLSGVWLVKACNLEPVMVERFEAKLAGYNNRWMRATRASELPGPLIEFGGTIGLAILLGVVALTPAARTSASTFFTFVLTIVLLYQRIRSLIKLLNLLIQARAASRRVFEILDTRSDLLDPPNPVPLRAANAPIHFEDVHFAYDGKVALEGIRLVIPPGKMVALVGPSGAGKTTLANLLLRFHDPDRGRIRIGDTDLRHVSQKDLRDHIAVVGQDVFLFHDTIRRNLELGRPGASIADIEEAARHAHAHAFIVEKPQGYDTVVGERGSALSGGQRQRLAIARALLRSAPILILDEATSALDTESERFVQQALETLMQGRTSLCIAHRLSTIQRADLIVVMEQGRIVDQGRHEELLARGGLYRKLY
ncbi:MAG: ABC transporter ATP-binding protein, partial [Verrucomicrobiales bacterium]|nr:ABC transporter ATP-binding protein [Verrucomicrobiales bacterium]